MKSKVFVCVVIFGAFAEGSANVGEQKNAKADVMFESHYSTVQAKDGGNQQLAKLARGRLDAAKKAYERSRKIAGGSPFSDLLYHLSVRWLHADLDLAQKKEERVRAYVNHLERMKDWETIYENRAALDSVVFDIIGSFKKEGEFWLAKEKLAEN